MLFQLETTREDDIKKLLDLAEENNLKLSLVDDNCNVSLPGKPLSDEKLMQLITNSRESGYIKLQDAHDIIRRKYNGD